MSSQKELKQQYRQKKPLGGIFQVKNSLNNKIFISSGLDLSAAWNSQKFQLENGMHPNAELQKDWKMAGSKLFLYEVLAEYASPDNPNIDPKKELKDLEDLYINELQPFEPTGYNKRKK